MRSRHLMLLATVTLLTTACRAPGVDVALTPCHVDSLAEEVQCGVIEVLEDRRTGRGPRIPIHVTVLPPLRRSSEPDPLVVLAGGPGQGARGLAGIAARVFKTVRRTRAIVLVDLRGTGDSASLACLVDRDPLAMLGADPGAFVAEGAACAAELSRDPRHYTHANALADLDEIRQRLGYQQTNLWGGSWGTRAAVLYALAYPHAVRRIVLDGAVALDMSFPRSVAADTERAFELLVQRCAAEPLCRHRLPDPRRELREVLNRLKDPPVSVRIRDPRTGRPVRVTLTRDAVAEVLRVALYTPVDAARLLQLVHSAASGDYAPLVAQHVHASTVFADDMALGATLAILCSEDVPLVRHADFAAEARDTQFGAGYAEAWVARCSQWPAGPPLRVDHTRRVAAPTLILSGALDPVTPPRAGEAMARWFASPVHVVVPGAAHNTSFSGCVPDLIAAFLDDTAFDPSCVADLPVPPIVVDSSGGRP